MNYIVQLLKEHSRSNTDRIATAIANKPSEFKKIIDIIYKEAPPLPQGAAWILAAVNDIHPELIVPYIPLFVNTIQDFKIDAVKRNMVNVLAQHQIPEKVQGKLISICFDLILSPSEPVVVKVHAMQIIANHCSLYPELKKELKAAVEDQLPKTTAAFHARARLIFK